MATTKLKGGQIFDGTIKSEDIDDALEKEFTKVRVTTGDLTPDFLSTKILTNGSVVTNVIGASGSAQYLAITGSGASYVGGNGTDNNILTADGSGGLVAESNISFNGSNLNITGSVIASNLSASDKVLVTSGSSRTISQATNLVWDTTNAYLGIAVAAPGRNLNVSTGARFGQTNYFEFVGANSTTWRWVNAGTVTTIEHNPHLIFRANSILGFNASNGSTVDAGFTRAAAGIINVSGSAPGALFRFNAASSPLAAGDLGMNTTSGRPSAYIGGAVKEMAHTGEIAPVTASYVVIGTDATLTNERVLTAGSGISITDGGAGSTVTIAATGGGGGADSAASYVVMAVTSSLANERALTAGTGLTLTDAGAGGNVTLAINDSTVATISGSTFTGAIKTKTHSAYAGSDFVITTGAVSTTNSSFTTIATITLSDNTVYGITAKIVGRQTSGGANRAFYGIASCFYREAAGSATQQGSTNTLFSAIESNASWDVRFNTSGNDVLVQVAGASVNISWTAVVEYHAVSSSS